MGEDVTHEGVDSSLGLLFSESSKSYALFICALPSVKITLSLADISVV
jgi:hypothetical protein